MISQVRWSESGMNIILGTEFSPWVLKKPPSPPPPPVEDDDVIIMKKFYISLGEVSLECFFVTWHFGETCLFRDMMFI